MSIAYVGLGGNLGDSQSIFDEVLSDFDKCEMTTLLAVSSYYITKPLDNMQQPDFLNAVARIDTTYSPHELLNFLQSLESRYGRVRTGENWASRTLDLDILLYDQLTIQDPELVVPHAGMLERDFVIYPLCEISPEVDIAGFGPISKALRTCENRGMKKLNEDHT